MNRLDKPASPLEHPPRPQNWAAMTGDEKFQYLAARWSQTEDREFATPEAAEKYRKRTCRVLDTIALRKPDQVPVNLMTVGYLLGHGDIQPRDTFYNPEKIIAAAEALHAEFNLQYSIISNIHAGATLDTLGLRLIRWPGSGVPGHALADGISHQYIEDEYMLADEYDELIGSPEGYLLRKYLPRICSGLTGLSTLPNLFNFVELSSFTGMLSALSKGTPARKALDTLLQAADLAAETAAQISQAQERIASKFGAPSFIAGVTFAPYDIIGDTMRCTRGITIDLYRHPEKVLAATKALVPMVVQMGKETTQAAENPFIFIPLHKGADIFLSQEQFRSFYWPSLKATILALIDAGCIPTLFLEGSYNRGLDVIADNPLPKGKSIWIFSQIDMKMAKEKIGDWACIAGNVPASLFRQGTPQMLEDYCRDLIENCAGNGGFFLFPGTILDQANSENIKTFLHSGRKFGRLQ